MNPPTDTFFGIQTHFNLIGDIQTIWNEYDGNGVNVGIYDDGVDFNHEDLSTNYNASLEVTNNFGNPVRPVPELSDDAHGTAVAGLIGAADNGIGTVGVAHGASLTGVNIFGANTYGFINSGSPSGIAAFRDVLSQGTNFDVINNSWGSTPTFSSSGSLANPNSGDARLEDEYELLAENGRGRLGTVIAQAAGNDNLDTNGDGTNASRFTITVSATDTGPGNAASFSNFGHSVLVAAPAASVTTDLTGTEGYNTNGGFGELSDNDYTGTFGGTSAATPVVSGVIALMLEANDGLGWRDVQNILASSASHTGSALGSASSGFEDGAWFFNGASNWNGGGNHFHVNYGYGLVDAFAAVRMAEVWNLFGAAQQSANEVKAVSNTFSPSGGIVVPEDNVGVDFTLNINSNVDIEHVALVLDIDTTYVGDLQLTLTSADGTTIEVYGGGNLGTDVNGKWYFGIDSLLGENARGVWSVNVQDRFAGDVLRVNSAQLEVYGASTTASDTYHFTDEVMDLVTMDPSRLVLNDRNGGADWLNFAALQAPGRLDIDLATNGSGGASIVGFGDISNISNGVIIENAVGGDGNDLITGNGAANRLYGMRGGDTIFGGNANDTVIGGAGQDVLHGQNGNDFVSGGSGDDHLTGGSGNDSLRGGLDNDQLISGGGHDRGLGDGGNDRLLGQGGRDRLEGGNGNDFVNGGADDDTLLGQDGNDQLIGGTGNDVINGGANNDRIWGQDGVDRLIGGSGDDFLNGGSGNDRLEGNGGADHLVGEAGDDALFGFSQNDILSGHGGNDRLVGGFGNDRLNGGADNDILWGQNGDDLLVGGSGNDQLIGGSGADRMIGQAGNDTFVFSNVFGADTITDFEGGAGVGDRINFSNVSAFGNFAQVVARSQDVGSNVVITVNGNDTVTLLNTSVSDLAADDFIF